MEVIIHHKYLFVKVGSPQIHLQCKITIQVKISQKNKMLIDYHLHNHFSPDSNEDTHKIVEKALKMGMEEICITNHVELHDKETGKSIFNIDEAIERFNKIQEELDKIRKIYPHIPIKFGVELEYMKEHMDELTKFVKATPFDFILGSVHIVNNVIIASHRFASELYKKTDEETAYNAYFDNLKKLVEWGHFDAVAHFDICKKFGYKFYGPFKPEKYKQQIMLILKIMKEKDIGLELNTKCLDNKCKEIFPHSTILKWAIEVGIKNYTMGSDAHKEAHVSQYIKEAYTVAKKVGIKDISTYSKRVPIIHSI